MSDVVRWEKQDGVAHIILNSPPANAMSPQLMAQLDHAVGEVAGDRDCRAVVFRSEVKKVFMAGADLKYLLSLDEPGFREYIKSSQDTFNRIESLPKPTIAILSGHALGGGCEFSLCCDFRYMADSGALIGLPEVGLGLLPGAGGTQRLPRLIGRSKATELLLRGTTLKGPDALTIGLVDRVYPSESLLAESIRQAEELARGATEAIAQIKACLRASSQEALSAGLAQELDGIAYLFGRTEDSKEGLLAFNEKRPPAYKGR
ncbi:MAG: enoyl-CoA hydratase/isomerase family protein [Deltaproteobacteria bacterium]|nr:enoyl-CoA hydratase/isomerase family protein [Deltaproteobacteria bacterium]